VSCFVGAGQGEIFWEDVVEWSGPSQVGILVIVGDEEAGSDSGESFGCAAGKVESVSSRVSGWEIRDSIALKE